MQEVELQMLERQDEELLSFWWLEIVGSVLFEPIDWLLTARDLLSGDMGALIGFLPLIPASIPNIRDAGRYMKGATGDLIRQILNSEDASTVVTLLSTKGDGGKRYKRINTQMTPKQVSEQFGTSLIYPIGWNKEVDISEIGTRWAQTPEAKRVDELVEFYSNNEDIRRKFETDGLPFGFQINEDNLSYYGLSMLASRLDNIEISQVLSHGDIPNFIYFGASNLGQNLAGSVTSRASLLDRLMHTHPFQVGNDFFNPLPSDFIERGDIRSLFDSNKTGIDNFETIVQQGSNKIVHYWIESLDDNAYNFIRQTLPYTLAT